MGKAEQLLKTPEISPIEIDGTASFGKPSPISIAQPIS
jgi:hypothetical protein